MNLIKIVTLALFFCLTGYSQTDPISGGYARTLGGDEHRIEYKLDLNQDGTFFFHSYTNHKKGIPWERNLYGKGSWSAQGIVVSFFCDEEKDIDEKHTLDFSNSRARFITKHARDKTDRVVDTRLQFFESEIFWIERLKILKK